MRPNLLVMFKNRYEEQVYRVPGGHTKAILEVSLFLLSLAPHMVIRHTKSCIQSTRSESQLQRFSYATT